MGVREVEVIECVRSYRSRLSQRTFGVIDVIQHTTG